MTSTRPTQAAKPVTHQSTPANEPAVTYSASQVLDALDHRISYRILDNWIRIGTIQIADRSKGSGKHRRFTRDEIEMLHEMIDHCDHLRQEYAEFYSGVVWDELVVNQRFRHPRAS